MWKRIAALLILFVTVQHYSYCLVCFDQEFNELTEELNNITTVNCSDLNLTVAIDSNEKETCFAWTQYRDYKTQAVKGCDLQGKCLREFLDHIKEKRPAFHSANCYECDEDNCNKGEQAPPKNITQSSAFKNSVPCIMVMTIVLIFYVEIN